MFTRKQKYIGGALAAFALLVGLTAGSCGPTETDDDDETSQVEDDD